MARDFINSKASSNKVVLESDQTGSAPLPGLATYLIGCAVVAAWIDFGTIHRDQHSDSILNVLISLYRWTPFVWEQDRFGMLVPLIARPIQHPLANLLFQSFLSIFAGLSAFFLLARYTLRDAGDPLVGTISAAAMVSLTPAYYRFEYLVDTSYGIGFSLGLWALILIEAGGRSRLRWVVALVLMALAHWVNNAMALFLGPFVLIRGLLDLGSPSRWLEAIRAGSGVPLGDRLRGLIRWLWSLETVRSLVLLGVGYQVGQLLIGLSDFRPTDLSPLPVDQWPDAWVELIRVTVKGLGAPYWLGLMGVLGAVGLSRGGIRSRRGGALIGAAVTIWLLMGTRKWVKINAYEFRYLFPSVLLIQPALIGLAVRGWSPPRGWPRWMMAPAATLVLLATATGSYGLPSLAGVRRDIDQRCGRMTVDLLDSRSTCLAGDYWTVWRSVYHANLVLHERGDSRILWGVTFRASPLFGLWKDTPMEGRRAAIPVGDGMGEGWLQSFRFPKLEEVETRPTIRVYRPIPPRR